MFVRDADGDYAFVDRLKDAIRRRGENISSYEVEVEILSHPDVREAAVVAVPSAYTEDEVLAVLSPVEGRGIDQRGAGGMGGQILSGAAGFAKTLAPLAVKFLIPLAF